MYLSENFSSGTEIPRIGTWSNCSVSIRTSDDLAANFALAASTADTTFASVAKSKLGPMLWL
jgi:hypothetical protein